MALSRIVSEIFNVEKCRDLEIRVRGHSRSLTWRTTGRQQRPRLRIASRGKITMDYDVRKGKTKCNP